MENKSKRGGKRPGAGRKHTGVAALHCYPQAETVQRIRERAQLSGRTIGQVIDAALRR